MLQMVLDFSRSETFSIRRGWKRFCLVKWKFSDVNANPNYDDVQLHDFVHLKKLRLKLWKLFNILSPRYLDDVNKAL